MARSRWAGPQRVKEESCDPDYLPRARMTRRRPIADEFDRDCGYAYEHTLVFIRYTYIGTREYECTNCGERTYLDEYTCDPDIHEMLEVGKFELAFQPPVTRSLETIRAMARDRRTYQERRRRKEEEESYA